MSKNKKQIYYSIRTVEARTHKQALNKVLNEEFAEDELLCDKILTIKQLSKQLKLKEKEGYLYAQKCSVTGKGMNEGWMIGDLYFKYKKDADKHARTIPNEENPKKGNYKNFKQLYNSMDEDNNDFCYWTQWEMPTDAQYIVKDGKLTDI